MGQQNAPMIEVLARMAARMSGRDPDQHLTDRLRGEIVFEGPIWQHPDFLQRAEIAYALLAPDPDPKPNRTS